MTTAYYWRGTPNFGDLMSPYLVEHFANVSVEWAEPYDADVVCAGSVLDVVPDGWAGIVAGSGKLHESTQTDLRQATVLGLRGYLTAGQVLMSDQPVIGDPGLLAPELVHVEREVHEVGIVPHWTDTTLYPRFVAQFPASMKPILIDVSQDPLAVIQQIASCKKIVASSLHGVIVADSFGIPRRVEPFAKMTSPYEGGDFKFRDYGTSIGQPIEFSKLGGQVAPRDAVERIQSELFDLFADLGKLCRAKAA